MGIGWFGWDRRVGSATRTFSMSASSAFEGKEGGRETTQNSRKRVLGVIPPAICMVVRTILNGQSDVIRQFKVTCSYSRIFLRITRAYHALSTETVEKPVSILSKTHASP